MAEHFILSSDADDFARLLSYSGTVKGGKLILSLKVEIEGWRMHSELEALEAIQQAHKPKPQRTAPKKQPKAKPKPLALPAPSLALPGPQEGGEW
ncbi:MAG: hypothetical protein Q4G25_12665 [Paracoccus sp. (in: a-proteobacteria)]|nr:hypothetical protein [Paracoccus sp. (in: a-proteobacteria)]